MPIPYGPLALSAGQTITETTVQWPNASQAVILNMSPYTLRINPYIGTGMPIIAPNTQDLIQLGNQYSGRLDITAQADLSTAASAPAFVVYVMVFAAGEQVTGVYPAQVPIVTIGGGTLSGGGVASSVVNNGNAVVTPVVEATPQGASGSELLWNNDGSGIWGGGIATVDNKGQQKMTWPSPPATVVLFDWDDSANAGGHRIRLKYDTAAKQIILEDFTANEELMVWSCAAAGGVLLPQETLFLSGGMTVTAGLVSVLAPDTLSAGNQLTTIGGGAQHVVNTTAAVAVAIPFSPNLTNVATGISDVILASSQETGLGFATFQKYGCDMFWKGTVATSNTEVVATCTTQGN